MIPNLVDEDMAVELLRGGSEPIARLFVGLCESEAVQAGLLGARAVAGAGAERGGGVDVVPESGRVCTEGGEEGWCEFRRADAIGGGC